MKLEIKNLTTIAFSNVNLELSQRGLYGIIGRNGAGKSTLFTALNGEMRYQGEIHILDGEFDGRVAYVSGLEIFDGNLSANDYIEVLKGQELENAKKYLPIFQAERFFKKPIRKYSLGMKEILAFIFLVSLNADVLIVDELMNGLDNQMRDNAFHILKELANEKIILLTSHILEEVEKNCDKVYFLAKDGFSEVKDFDEAKKLVQENEVFI